MAEPPKTQVVLITGATRGIGRLAALELARRGHRVIATGRDVERLHALAAEARGQGVAITAQHLDVNDAGACEAVVGQAVASHGRLDALVNNAGYGLWGPLEELSPREIEALFQTNVFAALRLSQLALPQMRAQGFGTIVNVGSMAGQIGAPASGAYAASKAAMLMLSRVLRQETRGDGVRVVLLEPGVFETDFHRNSRVGRQVYREDSPYRERVLRLRTRPPGEGRWRPDPAPVAHAIRRVIEGRWPRGRYAVGVDARAGAIAARLLPDWLFDWLIRKALRW